MVFQIAAILILLLFYSIYFIKQYSQKKRGIQTRQLGTGKEKRTRTIERVLSAATLLIVPVQLISIFLRRNILPSTVTITAELFSNALTWRIPRSGIQTAGIIVAALGDLIFLLAVVTMRDSWRAGIPAQDQTDLITKGIYRYSRNPAFLGFDLMYTGILFAFLNWTLLVFTAWAVIMLHLQILQEEKFLLTAFGEAYARYKAVVHRYFGRKRPR